MQVLGWNPVTSKKVFLDYARREVETYLKEEGSRNCRKDTCYNYDSPIVG
jgi:hypothetical protein